MYEEMVALGKNDVAFFSVKLQVHPVNDAPPLWPPGLDLFDVKAYYFAPKANYGWEKTL